MYAENPVESSLEVLEDADKGMTGNYSSEEQATKKLSPEPSPPTADHWQAPLLFHSQSDDSSMPPVREQSPESSPYTDDSSFELSCRGRRSCNVNSNTLLCWLMALVTINTLALCFGLWQLRIRTSRMMHVQEVARGELTETIRNHLFLMFDQGIGPPSPGFSSLDDGKRADLGVMGSSTTKKMGKSDVLLSPTLLRAKFLDGSKMPPVREQGTVTSDPRQ